MSKSKKPVPKSGKTVINASFSEMIKLSVSPKVIKANMDKKKGK